MNTLFFKQVSLGISQAYNVNSAIEEEASIRQGRNHHVAATIQTEQLNMALSQFLGLLDVLRVPISTPLIMTKNIIAFSPTILAYIANRKDLGLRTRKILNFVQDQYVKVSLAVSAITTAAFFAMGHTIYSVTTVLFLSLGLLDRKGYLPPKIRTLIYQTGSLISNISGMLYGDNLTQCLPLMNLVGSVINVVLKIKMLKSKRNDPSSHPNIPATQVTPTLLNKLISDTLPISLNKSHVNKPFLPPLKSDVNLNQLIEYSENIDWNKHEKVLQKKLANDARWNEVGILGSEKPIDYYKKCLRAFVKSIQERNIIHGKPENYDKLEHYCLILTQSLANQNETTNVDILLEIGLGGEYCGSGKFRILEERVALTTQNMESYPLEKRILAYLQELRMQKWGCIYECIWKSTPLTQLAGWYLDKNDIHIHNLFLNISKKGKELGLPHDGALNDRFAAVPPWVEFMNIKFKSIISKIFWDNQSVLIFDENRNLLPADKWNFTKWYSLKKYTFESYNQKSVISYLSEMIGKKNAIPKPQVYEWWRGWILKQNLNQDQKDQLLDELTFDNKLFGAPLEENGKINPIFLNAMLLEMGIFHV